MRGGSLSWLHRAVRSSNISSQTNARYSESQNHQQSPFIWSDHHLIAALGQAAAAVNKKPPTVVQAKGEQTVFMMSCSSRSSRASRKRSEPCDRDRRPMLYSTMQRNRGQQRERPRKNEETRSEKELDNYGISINQPHEASTEFVGQRERNEQWIVRQGHGKRERNTKWKQQKKQSIAVEDEVDDAGEKRTRTRRRGRQKEKNMRRRMRKEEDQTMMMMMMMIDR